MLSRKDGNVGYVIFKQSRAPQRRCRSRCGQRTAEILDEVRARRRGAGGGDHRRGGKSFVCPAPTSRNIRRERCAPRRMPPRSTMQPSQGERVVYGCQADNCDVSAAMYRRWTGARGCDATPCASATDNSKFAIPAAKLGLGYSYPGVKRLSDLVGLSFAKEIFFTARQIRCRGRRASWGWSTGVVPPAEIEAYVKKLCRHHCGQCPADRQGRQVSSPTRRCGTRASATLTAAPRSWSSSPRRTTYTEGRRAFMEKRKPAFTGT